MPNQNQDVRRVRHRAPRPALRPTGGTVVTTCPACGIDPALMLAAHDLDQHTRKARR